MPLDRLDRPRQYFVHAPGGGTVGPVDEELVRLGHQAGSIPDDALVCAVGDTQWRPLAAVLTEPNGSEVRSRPPPPDVAPNAARPDTRIDPRAPPARRLVRWLLVTAASIGLAGVIAVRAMGPASDSQGHSPSTAATALQIPPRPGERADLNPFALACPPPATSWGDLKQYARQTRDPTRRPLSKWPELQCGHAMVAYKLDEKGESLRLMVRYPLGGRPSAAVMKEAVDSFLPNLGSPKASKGGCRPPDDAKASLDLIGKGEWQRWIDKWRSHGGSREALFESGAFHLVVKSTMIVEASHPDLAVFEVTDSSVDVSAFAGSPYPSAPWVATSLCDDAGSAGARAAGSATPGSSLGGAEFEGLLDFCQQRRDALQSALDIGNAARAAGDIPGIQTAAPRIQALTLPWTEATKAPLARIPSLAHGDPTLLLALRSEFKRRCALRER